MENNCCVGTAIVATGTAVGVSLAAGYNALVHAKIVLSFWVAVSLSIGKGWTFHFLHPRQTLGQLSEFQVESVHEGR